MRLIDSHCHLDVAEFHADLSEALTRAEAAGVGPLVVPAIAHAGWPRLAQLAAQHPAIKPAYGLHPVYLAEHAPAHLAELGAWLQRPECVAVGECGLDFHEPGLDRACQEFLFCGHLQLAREHDLPLIIHARKSTERVLQLLKQFAPLRGVVHSYSGSLEQARQLVRMGFLLGVAGPITYPRSQRIRTWVKAIGLQHLLLETDSPDQPMHGRQGRRNEPAMLPQVCDAVAEAIGIPGEQVAAATSENARRLFGLAA